MFNYLIQRKFSYRSSYFDKVIIILLEYLLYVLCIDWTLLISNFSSIKNRLILFNINLSSLNFSMTCIKELNHGTHKFRGNCFYFLFALIKSLIFFFRISNEYMIIKIENGFSKNKKIWMYDIIFVNMNIWLLK